MGSQGLGAQRFAGCLAPAFKAPLYADTQISERQVLPLLMQIGQFLLPILSRALSREGQGRGLLACLLTGEDAQEFTGHPSVCSPDFCVSPGSMAP